MAEKDVFIIQKGHQPGRGRTADGYQPKSSGQNAGSSSPSRPPARLFQSVVVNPNKKA